MKIIELFAGVGGFRVGFENISKKNKFVWSNQWEPSTKRQHASEVYENVFGKEGHCNEDINNVKSSDIPSHDLLCGGFPCFTKGHKVLTEKGYKNIEEIVSGDMVLTHKNRFKKVVVPMKKKSNHICFLQIQGYKKIIEVTEEHPFYVVEKDNIEQEPKWIELKNLEIDKHYILNHRENSERKDYFIKTKDYFMYEINSITRKEEEIEVYNFEVEEDNSYTIEDIIVHNCQTFSIMRPKNKSEGLSGEKGDKGILFWEIHRIAKDHKTPYLFLENVDRLLISPANQKGKDMAVIVKSLMDLGYIVEWRVVNAAEYGFPQKRRRTFIFAYQIDSEIAQNVFSTRTFKDTMNIIQRYKEIVSPLIQTQSIFGQTFPIEEIEEKEIETFELNEELYEISEGFNKGNKKKNPFLNSGIAFGNKVYTVKTKPKYKGKYTLLKDIILPDNEVGEEFFADDKETFEKWRKAKDRIHKERINKITGEKYIFKGGAVPFPDKLDSAARTIITSEGGKSASRTTHVINPKGRLRRLHPIELERIQGFPDNHTKLEGISNAKRGFLLGNALVVGVVEEIAKTMKKILGEK